MSASGVLNEAPIQFQRSNIWSVQSFIINPFITATYSTYRQIWRLHSYIETLFSCNALYKGTFTLCLIGFLFFRRHKRCLKRLKRNFISRRAIGKVTLRKIVSYLYKKCKITIAWGFITQTNRLWYNYLRSTQTFRICS